MRVAFRLLSVVPLLVLAAACGGPDATPDPEPVDATASRMTGEPTASEGSAAEEDHEDEHAGEATEIRLTPEQAEAMQLETAEVAQRRFHRDVRTTGEVVLNDERTVHIVSKVSGWIERLDAFLRDEVAAGQTLALVYSPDYLTALTELIQAERRLDRARQAGDEDALQTAEAILRASRQKLRILGADEAAIENAVTTGATEGFFELETPIGGTVVESHAVLGSAIEPGAELFHIANLATLWVDVDVYEDDLRFVNEGDEITLTVKAYPDRQFDGRITQLGGLLDPESRTVKARAVAQNPDRRLRPGMFADIVIHTQPLTEEIPSIPATAVQTLEDVPVVFVREGPDHYTVREIQPGEEEDGLLLVHSGLEPGEVVVTRGSFLIKSELLKGTFEAGHGH